MRAHVPLVPHVSPKTDHGAIGARGMQFLVHIIDQSTTRIWLSCLRHTRPSAVSFCSFNDGRTAFRYIKVIAFIIASIHHICIILTKSSLSDTEHLSAYTGAELSC